MSTCVITLTEPQSSPRVCAGSGTIMADFMPAMSSLPTIGRCGICGRDVPLMFDCQTLAPHPYLPEAA